MIIFDGVHLYSDTSEHDLHEFAKRVGLKREWYQGPPRHRVWHYDVTSKTMARKVIAAGAKEMKPLDAIKLHPDSVFGRRRREPAEPNK